MPFTQDEVDYLATQRLGRLATVQPNGTLQVSPVGFSYNADLGVIDISGYNMAASRKYRNIADNGREAFVVDDIASVQPWRVRCLEIRGTGEAIEAPADSAAGMAGPIIRVHPQRIISFGLDKADVDPHLATPNIRDAT
ncbi:PPOX class F420-dependent oxidoreductase [Actinoallomurus bryophytorum]|uniref:Pyridoxamine 5'-phosphate oxidase family protein n=1 Tax=Actinoallomurus bryophytorum TaxID=1490222 RepID=A0A543CM86_9ACTN|nr:PPOX class F420-dependent oxidoreductase [Actinoallomurus bryophytorum]TQL98037.1 pyridoxamine 5'-phosphate oxidase family protein [Actinoallomurus bryophytorum]